MTSHVPSPCTPPADIMEKASPEAIVMARKEAIEAEQQQQQQQHQCKTKGGTGSKGSHCISGVGGTDSEGSHRIGGIGGSTASSSAASSSKHKQQHKQQHQQQQQDNTHGNKDGKKVVKKPAARKKPSGSGGLPAPGTPRHVPWRPELSDGFRECQFCRNLVCTCSKKFLQNVKRDTELYGHYKAPLP